MRSKIFVLAIVGLAAAGLTAAIAQDTKAAPQMTAEQQAEMATYMKYATPGQAHALLKPFVGSFNVTSTMWQAPGTPPEVSKGTSENTWVLGERWVQQHFKGEVMGMPFEGIGFTGYDNFKKKYVGTWIDSMSTMHMVSTGTADASGKTFTATGTVDDVVTGKPATFREATKVIDANTHVMEMFGADKTGKEFKMMEIVYTRK